jgi:actin-like protein 6A
MSTPTPRRRRYFVGHDQSYRRDNMEIERPIQHGQVVDWDAIEEIWRFALERHLRVNGHEHPIMIAESSYTSDESREKLTSLLFEKFNVPALFICKDAVLAAFAAGKSTALVLDIGGGKTNAVPVYDGFAQFRGLRRTKVAGDTLDGALERLLFTNQQRDTPARYCFKREVVPETAVASTTGSGLGIGVGSLSSSTKLRITPLTFPNTTASFHRYQCLDLIRDIKESVCRVSETKFDASLHANMPVDGYELPDGKVIDIGVERFTCPELLFAPNNNLLEVKSDFDSLSEFQGLHSMLLDSGNSQDPDLRKELYANIIITGGCASFPGLATRLLDFGTTQHPPLKMKVVPPNIPTERRFGAWIGGSVLASLGSFHQMWFSRAEFNEHGAQAVGKKCP